MRTLIGPPARRDLRVLRGGDRGRSVGEGDEERVALCVDLDATVADERVAKHATVLGQHLGVALGSELVQQLGRALDVGEEERDGARRELAHALMMSTAGGSTR